MNRSSCSLFGLMRPPRAALLGLAALLTAMPLLADDAALYGPEAPPGSAFVRVFNASGRPELSVQIGSQAFDDVEAWRVSNFEFLAPGSVSLNAEGLSESVQLQPDHFYTAVVTDTGVELLDNQRFDNRLKALIILYNLTDSPELSLRTPDGSTAVIDEVGPSSFGTREVNATRATLALYSGEQQVAEAPPMTFSRGKAFSLFAVGPADSPRLVWATN